MSDDSPILDATIETCYTAETLHIMATHHAVHPIVLTIHEEGSGPSHAHLTREMASSLSQLLSAAVEITPDFYKESFNSLKHADAALTAVAKGGERTDG